MDRTEDATHRFRRGRMSLPFEQQLIAGAQVLAALRQEQLGVLREVHGELAEHALDGFEDARGLKRFDDEVFGARLNGLDDQRLLTHRAAH